MRKTVFLSFLGLMVSAVIPFVSAQTVSPRTALPVISGQVLDAETGDPVDFAGVFFSGTTRGMTTNEDGSFSLRLPGEGTYDLVATQIDYVTQSHTVHSQSLTDTVIVFRLKRSSLQVPDVVIREKRKVGVSYKNVFWRKFFGVDALNERLIKAENPDDVHFSFNLSTKRLRAECNKPIVVINNVLGYKIYYTLSEFTYDYNSVVTILRGYPRFEPLTPKNERQAEEWRQQREAAYRGSMMQFTRVLYDGSLQKAGFVVQGIVRTDSSQNAYTDWREQKRIRDAQIFLTKPLPVRQLVKTPPYAPQGAKELISDQSMMVSELIKKEAKKRKDRTDTLTLFTLHFKNNLIFFYSDGSYYPPSEVVKESYDRYGIISLLPWDYEEGL